MDEHPSRKVLEIFLRGELNPSARRGVIEHLLRGCGACMGEMNSLATLILHPERTPPAAEPEAEESYNTAIERAFAAARLHGRRASLIKRQKARALKVLAREGIDGLLRLRISHAAISEASLERAIELRYTDPDQMVALTELAAVSAYFVDQEGYPLKAAADLQARMLAEHANALRVVHRYADADRNIMTAFGRALEGTGDPWLSARLYDLLGSCLGSRYKYGEAVEAFEKVSVMYKVLGDRHLAGRAQIQQGFYAGLGGSPGKALRLLETGARKIDSAREPELAGIAIHNRLLFLAEAGQFKAALSLLIEQRDLLAKTGGAKLLGIEGRIYAGLGHLDMAEAAFRESKAQLQRSGDAAHAGLAALDLAALLLRQGRTAEGRAEAEEALATYQDLEIEREARKALKLLGETLRSELATAGYVQQVVDFLRNLEREPWLRFWPTFT